MKAGWWNPSPSFQSFETQLETNRATNAKTLADIRYNITSLEHTAARYEPLVKDRRFRTRMWRRCAISSITIAPCSHCRSRPTVVRKRCVWRNCPVCNPSWQG